MHGDQKEAQPTHTEKNFLKSAKQPLKKKYMLLKTLAMLKFKCWYYEKALADGNEDKINEMLPDMLPAEIRQLYDRAHG